MASTCASAKGNKVATDTHSDPLANSANGGFNKKFGRCAQGGFPETAPFAPSSIGTGSQKVVFAETPTSAASSSSPTKKQRAHSKRSLRLSVFRRKEKPPAANGNVIDHTAARRTASLGNNHTANTSEPTTSVAATGSKEASQPTPSPLAPSTSTQASSSKSKGFCCSFRPPKSTKKRTVEPANSLSAQVPCVLLTPEYGACISAGGSALPTGSPNKQLVESSIMPANNAVEQHLLSAVQPSSLPTRCTFCSTI
uniref:Uncharacterized protein n=1 Tax=Panagrellus redivivus TaxID=6233 RepID=A0A7E4W840_PANRE